MWTHWRNLGFLRSLLGRFTEAKNIRISLHDTKKWSNIPYKLVDQSTVVEDMNSPSWHSYDYILSFCILNSKQQSQNQSQMKQWVSPVQQEYVDNP